MKRKQSKKKALHLLVTLFLNQRAMQNMCALTYSTEDRIQSKFKSTDVHLKWFWTVCFVSLMVQQQFLWRHRIRSAFQISSEPTFSPCSSFSLILEKCHSLQPVIVQHPVALVSAAVDQTVFGWHLVYITVHLCASLWTG